MFKRSYKVYSLIFTCIIVLSLFTTPLRAIDVSKETSILESYELVQPRWSNVTSSSIGLTKANGKIYIDITILGNSGTTFSNGTIVLQKINGSKITLIRTWRNLSSNSVLFDFTNNENSYTAGTYRVVITITATRNGVSETITLDKETTFS